MTLKIEEFFALAESELNIWTSQKYLTIEEGAMLLVGASPRFLHHARWCSSRAYELHSLLVSLIERELVGRELFHRQVEPQRFLQMAEDCRAHVPAEFRKLVLKNKRKKPRPQSDTIPVQTNSSIQAPEPEREERLDPRTKETLYKILFAIAVEKYHFKPESTRSEVPAKIESALARQGLIVSQKTIRLHLKAAAEGIQKRK